jgi:hypothetical protein
MSHKCPECDTPDCDCRWYDGFDAAWEGRPPESPDELYLAGFCDGVLDLEESDAEDAEEKAAWDDEEHPDSEYQPEPRGG